LVLVLLRQHSGAFLIPDGNKLEGVFLKAAIEKYGSKGRREGVGRTRSQINWL
jgi:hypothetical protein